jgi:hypothetical protein
MHRSLAVSSLLLLLSFGGCSSSTTLDTDAFVVPDAGNLPLTDGGTDAATITMVDAFVPPPDTGPGVDGGRDAGPDAPNDVGAVLPPIDGGNPFGDAGALGDPAWVPLTVLVDGSMCEPLDPCGGDITGTWDVSGGCFAADLSAIRMCPGAHASGSGMARGRVTFDGAVAHRVAQSEVDILVTVPALCAGFVGGCSGIETRIRMATPDAACTTETDGSCRCQARQTNVIDDTDAYTTSMNEIIGTSSGRHWAYCVSGTGLSYEDTTPGSGPREPGIVDLTMH